MAAVPISNGGLQAGPDTADNHVTFTGPINPDANGLISVLVQVVSITGTGIKFGVSNIGDPIAGDAYSAPIDYKQVFTYNPNQQQLRFQCSNAADSFNISI